MGNPGTPDPQDALIGVSPCFQVALDQLRRIALTQAPALIEGETGCGKELAARAIHYWGARREGPFVPVNCGALPDHLIEAELFGHERGAFTDAKAARAGLVVEARGGTLFLDEVDALSPKAQVVLLRFLQDQRFRPLGSAREQHTDVRVLAASNRPLEGLVQRGELRADLMFRLKILQVRLPSLRERGRADIECLTAHFMQRFAAQYGLAPRALDDASRRWMREYDWPGNVRELEAWVQRCLLMSDGPWAGLPHAATPLSRDAAAAPLPSYQSAKAEALRQFERDYLLNLLRQTGGNVSHAARLAGKERRALGKLFKKHGIDPLSLN